MSTQKIVLINGSRLFRGMLQRVIKRADGLKIEAVIDELSTASDVIQEVHPDWIIFTVDPDDDSIPEGINNILMDNPSLRLLVMRTDASKVRMLWNEPHDITLEGKDLTELLDILRNNGIQANIFEGKGLSEYTYNR